MPALLQSEIALGRVPQPFPSEAGAVIAKRATIALSANWTVNDVVEMLAIPANCRPVDVIVDADDLDSNGSPTITFDVGIMSGAFGSKDSSRTVGQEFFAAATVAQTGGSARPTKKEAFRVGSSDTERAVGLKATAVAATFVAGTIGLTLFYVAE